MSTKSFNMPQRYLFNISDMDHGKPWLCWMCGHPRSDSPWPHTVEEITEEFADKPDAKRKLSTIPDGATQVYICRDCSSNRQAWRPDESLDFECVARRYSWMSEEHYLKLRNRLTLRAGRLLGKSRVAKFEGRNEDRMRLLVLENKANNLLELVDSIWNRNHLSFSEWHANPWTRGGEVTAIASDVVSARRADVDFAVEKFRSKKLGLNRSAEASGLTLEKFMELLGERGVPVIDLTGDELDYEFRDLEDKTQ